MVMVLMVKQCLIIGTRGVRQNMKCCRVVRVLRRSCCKTN